LGKKICLAKIVSGVLHVRHPIQVGNFDERVKAIQVFENDTTKTTNHVEAGRIAKIWSLTIPIPAESILQEKFLSFEKAINLISRLEPFQLRWV
jgi:hypothetical protein